MTTLESSGSKVTTSHQAKLAYVYVRQSSLVQMLRHGESTELQYQLVERAVQLGWPRDRVKTIDEDLGKSGASAVDRSGFQALMTEIGRGRVGLVLSYDASRRLGITVIGINCWSCARCSGPSLPTGKACMTLGFMPTACC
jgi:hypothetical protein